MLITDPCFIDSTFTIYSHYPIITSITVNPNNPDEFAFVKKADSTSCCKKSLMIFNMATKELRLVYEGAVEFPDWSKKNWILFENYDDYKFYKIKSNGDSLTQCLNPISSHRFRWNSEGDKFIYGFYENGDLGVHICDEDGAISQTYESNFSTKFDTWRHDSLLASADNYYPYDSNTYINVFTPIEVMNSSSYHAKAIIFGGEVGRGCDWIDNEILVVATSNGIYKVNFANPMVGEVEKIFEKNCNSSTYKNPCIVRQTKKVILQRTDFEITGKNQATAHTSLVSMNLDGTNEETIEIPGL